jgi:hypothetical protein
MQYHLEWLNYRWRIDMSMADADVPWKPSKYSIFHMYLSCGLLGLGHEKKKPSCHTFIMFAFNALDNRKAVKDLAHTQGKEECMFHILV